MKQETLKVVADINHFLLSEENEIEFYPNLSDSDFHLRQHLKEIKKILYPVQIDDLDLKVRDQYPELCVRTLNVCLDNNLRTMNNVFLFGKKKLFKLRGAGKAVISELDNWFRDRGYNWEEQTKIEEGD